MFGYVVERFPQGVVGADEALGKVSRVDKRLSFLSPEQIVGRAGIDGVLIGCQSPLTELTALLTFCRVVIGKREPGSDTCHQAAEGLHINHLAVAIVEGGGELGLHVLLQFAFGHILQYGLCHLIGQGAPVFAVGLLGLLFLGCLGGQEQHEGCNQGE